MSVYDYVYQLKDHLGNIRLSFSDKDNDGKIDVLRNNSDIDGDGDLAHEILQEKNYYPFGLKHKGYNDLIISEHKYGFGGKEEQNELGLGWIDITARNYDPALGRWMNLDPLAEKMRRHSPYNYAFDNPIYFQDPDGMMPQGPGNPIFKALAKALRKAGRKGKQARLKSFVSDPKVGKSDKGWVKSEINQMKRGDKKRKSIRNPPGKDLAHERGREAAKGYGYEHANLQNRLDHKNQHKYDNYGRKNKERPVVESTAATKITVGVLVTEGSMESSNDNENSSSNSGSTQESGDPSIDTGIESMDVLMQFSYDTLDVYENAGKKVFGDNEVGKFVDQGLNPFSLGVFDFFKSMLKDIE